MLNFLKISQYLLPRAQWGGGRQGGWVSMHNRSRAPTDIFLTKFGRTELIIGPSRAKNCQEDDLEVRFSLEAPKPCQKGEKRPPRPKKSRRKKFFSAENWIDGDRLKRVLAKFEADLNLN